MVSDTIEDEDEVNIKETEEKEENQIMTQQLPQQPVMTQPLQHQPIQQSLQQLPQQPVITQSVQYQPIQQPVVTQPEQSQNPFTTITPLQESLQQPTLNLKPIIDEVIEESNTSSINLFKKPMIQIEPIVEEQSVDKTENPNVKTIKVDTEALQLNKEK